MRNFRYIIPVRESRRHSELMLVMKFNRSSSYIKSIHRILQCEIKYLSLLISSSVCSVLCLRFIDSMLFFFAKTTNSTGNRHLSFFRLAPCSLPCISHTLNHTGQLGNPFLATPLRILTPTMPPAKVSSTSKFERAHPLWKPYLLFTCNPRGADIDMTYGRDLHG